MKIAIVAACVAMAVMIPQASLIVTITAGVVAALSWAVVWHNYFNLTAAGDAAVRRA